MRSGSRTTSPGALDWRSSGWWLSLSPARLGGRLGLLSLLPGSDLAAPAPVIPGPVPAACKRPGDRADQEGQARTKRVRQQGERLPEGVLAGVAVDLDGPEHELQDAALDLARGLALGRGRRVRIDRVAGASGLA